MRRGWLGKIISMVLVVALVITFPGILEISDVYAASSNDVGIISVSATGNTITATLFNYSNTTNMKVTEISYYVDGKRVKNDKSGLTLEKRTKETVSANVTTDTSKKHKYTVNIKVADDSNYSNNNRTTIVYSGEEEVTAQEEVTTVKVEEQTTEAPTTQPAADAGTLSIVSVTQPTIDELTIGGQCTLKAKVKNSTTGTASGIVQFYVDNNYIGEVAVSQLAAGSEQDVELEWTVTQGNHDFKVITQTSTTSGNKQTDEKTVHVDTVNIAGESGQSDLVVTDITWSPSTAHVGDQVVFTALVKNQGTATTKFYTGKEVIGVRFDIDSDGNYVNWSDNFTYELGPGQSAYLTATGGPNNVAYYTPDTNKTYTVYAYVDDAGRLSNESNTDNNKLQKTMYVANAPSIELPSGSTSGGTVKAFSVPTGKSQASGIAVTVENEEVGVFNTTVNNSRKWDVYAYQDTPVSIFEFSGTVTVRVVSNKTLTSATVVRPLSAGITPKIVTENGINYVEFTLSENGSYTVEFNGETQGALQLIANPITEEPTGSVTKVSAGSSIGDITVGSGQTLYVEGGAAVYGRVTLSSNAKVVGSGIIQAGGSWGNISINVNSITNSSVEGVTIVNAPSWTVECYNSSQITFDYLHIISATPNSDGISIQSCDNITINNGYFRTWDDGVVLKNYISGRYTNNISVNKCVFWTDLAQSMEIGAETNKGNGNGATIYAAYFTDIDVVHGFHKPAISIHNCDNATISDVKWENVTVEDAQMGNNGDNEDGWPLVIDITNIKGGEVDGTASSWTTNSARGVIDNITLKNIKVLEWNNNWSGSSPDGKAPGIRIRNSSSGGTITNIKINGLTVGSHSINSVSDMEQYMYSYTDETSNQDHFYGFDYNNQLKFNQ